MDLQPGSTVGDYQVVSLLGAGGMGKVYKVRNMISDRFEALKVLLPDLAAAPELADRFLREIKVQASLEHPNIAALHNAMRIQNQLLMVMEFVDGVTLERELKGGPLPVWKAVDCVAQVLSALSYAHSHGVIHRDVKPANMILTVSGVVKLMDFGIAKAASDHRLTLTGTTLGSLYYMSPEQIRGLANLDARADIYSAGVSLYELVTGKRPFDGDSQFAIMAAHLENTPTPPITLDPGLPEALNDAILMAVARDRDTRFQTADAFHKALASAIGKSQAMAPGLSPLAHGSPARRLARRLGFWPRLH
ncbi:MAG: serine/threonine-protein kinase [Bryobacteraceae bacterium]